MNPVKPYPEKETLIFISPWIYPTKSSQKTFIHNPGKSEFCLVVPILCVLRFTWTTEMLLKMLECLKVFVGNECLKVLSESNI